MSETETPAAPLPEGSAPAEPKKQGWLRRLFGGGKSSAPVAPAEEKPETQPETNTEDAAETAQSAVSAVVTSESETVAEALVSETPAEPVAVALVVADEEPVPTTDTPAPTLAPTLAPTPAPTPALAAGKKSWFQRLKEGLSRSSSKLSQGITDLFTKRKLDDEALEELEELLIQADLGVKTAATLTKALARSRFGKEISPEEIRSALAEEAARLLEPVAQPLVLSTEHKPHVVLVVGVNGAGKTTTIGKMARQYRDQGLQVSLAAGDTFRAAAVEQLKVWGDRSDCPVFARETGADAAGLAYDALQQARARGDDVLMIDTAGRLHNKSALMEELQKVRRVLRKLDPTAPHTTLLVLDATVGQNAHQQVKIFGEMIDVTGLVMTKLDGTAKGGVVVALAQEYGLPVHFVGVGESVEDLRPFAADDFARSLMGLAEASA